MTKCDCFTKFIFLKKACGRNAERANKYIIILSQLSESGYGQFGVLIAVYEKIFKIKKVKTLDIRAYSCNDI